MQRTFAAKNLAEGQKGTLFAAVMKLVGPLYLVLPGIIAWHIVNSGNYDLGKNTIPSNANGAYGFLVNLVLPDWAIGFFAATIFGAILSSFNSFLNSGSTLFAIDIYRGLLNPNGPAGRACRTDLCPRVHATECGSGIVLSVLRKRRTVRLVDPICVRHEISR